MEEYLTVSELTKYISRKFEYDPYLEKVYLKGEISNYNSRRKGKHQYFNIKDENAIISTVLFSGKARKVKFELEEGMSVLVSGRVSVYKPGGKYQIIVDSMQPDGIGALFLAYEQTKEKLTKEGLFKEELKKDIVKYPERIAVITSSSGAVIQDILTTVERRYPLVEIVLFPTQVQGEHSADSLVKSIELVEEKGDFDTIIIGRGGGSFEDLFSFNEEKVVRAIAAAETPVISSVGHETDTSLTDLVADLRAATPTAAAELAVPVLTDEIMNLNNYEERMIRTFQGKIQLLSKELAQVADSFIFRQPERLYDGYLQNVDQLEEKLILSANNYLRDYKQELSLLDQALTSIPIKQRVKEKEKELDYLRKELVNHMTLQLKDKKGQVNQLLQSLEHLSPLKIFSRGYSMMKKKDRVISSVDDLAKGDQVEVKLTDGEVKTEIKEIYTNEEQKDD
ncbi:MAG: exodeoxyribonuclease VII large subunit [Atopostipes sp.]|nr:exodeoxyribonuclease VII large subunit [Atopostipes sp.]